MLALVEWLGVGKEQLTDVRALVRRTFAGMERVVDGFADMVRDKRGTLPCRSGILSLVVG